MTKEARRRLEIGWKKFTSLSVSVEVKRYPYLGIHIDNVEIIMDRAAKTNNENNTTVNTKAK